MTMRDDIATTARGPSIHIQGLGLTLGRSSILENVCVDIVPGTIHCLIGPNGGGKTSLLRSLLGQMPHTGTIRIDWPAGRRIGYVPQQLDFDRDLPMTVDDFMAITVQDRPVFMGLSRRKACAVAEVLDAVGMSQKRKRRMGALSGGERQRVLFAQAMLPFPDLLILDEPMAGVDEVGSQFIAKAVMDIRAKGTTIVWIHHDLAEVRELADTVTCLNRTVVFTGDPAEVLSPEHILEIFSHAHHHGKKP
ncbi:MAG: metal ABC transporter ATP-binding protein [Alphaproteobacteria bacterium]|nr:metal ABC transporter ATP-binding protein [Alphaproteobacteria bacterium]